MPGRGKVIIRETEWDVAFATTYAEMSSGLGGVESMLSNEGMLFDFGSDTDIQITTDPMLFDLDIVFIETVDIDRAAGTFTATVVQINENIPPNLEGGVSGTGRFFLELNAGQIAEAGVQVGDNVDIIITIEEEVISNFTDMFMLLPIMMGMGMIARDVSPTAKG